ncbi:MAG: ROK family protein [Clostridiales bacterium]|nr:ROK family protein [Clostridiales bacterium]
MYRIGVDIGGTNIKIGLVDADGVIFVSGSIPFEKKGYESVCGSIAREIREIVSKADREMSEAVTLGIAVPGSLDVRNGIVKAAYNLDFFDVPLKAEMEKHFPGITVKIVNDADAAALAEVKAGALKGKNSAVMLTIGTGLGGGIILNGELFTGGNGNGIELGHMTIVKLGMECTCGSRGCAEMYCSAAWLERKSREVFGEGDAKHVIDLAKSGDPDALEIFDKYTDNLATAISSICALLDPEAFAIGGGVSECGDILYDSLKKKVKEKNFFHHDYEIVPASLGNKAGIIGAAML